MSDITYPRKADALTEVDPDGVPERLALAHVYATQGVAKALRELDGKLKYVADQIVRAMPQPVERWITWDDGRKRSLAVHRIQSFEEHTLGTSVTLVDGSEVTVKLSYGEVALMVGAV